MMEQGSEPSLIDHCLTGEGERSTYLSTEPVVISPIVTKEEDTYSLGYHERRESMTSPIDSGTMVTEIKDGHAEKSHLCKDQSEKNIVKAIHSCKEGANRRRQLWSGSKKELGEDMLTHRENGFNNSAHSSLHPRSLNIERPDMCIECESNQTNGVCHTCQTKKLQHRIQYPCSKCEKIYNLKTSLIRHQRKHTMLRIFQCPECEQSFIQKVDLNRHRRLHIGTQIEATKPIRERPYHCVSCEKSFIYYGFLIRHQRTHSGLTSRKRTHQGIQRKIGIRQMDNPIGHHRTHTELEPYECADCKTSCSENTDHVLQQRTCIGEITEKQHTNMVRLLEISLPNDYFLLQHGEDDNYQISEDTITYK